MTFKPESPVVTGVNPAHPDQIGALRPAARVSMVILHSMECGETSKAAENNTAWLHQRAKAQGYGSAHLYADNDTCVQAAEELRKTYGVIGYNDWAIHFEQAGRAGQTAAEWDDPYSRTMIDRFTIPYLIDVTKRRPTIPRRFLGLPDLVACIKARRQPAGITTHALCTAAAKACGMKNSGHSDPGVAYPIGRVMAALEAAPK